MSIKHTSIVIVLGAALAGCRGPGTPDLASVGAAGALRAIAQPATYTTKYVQLVIFENESYDDIIGNPDAPYINGLASQWANMTDSHAITHPSEPNYLALFSGSTQGVTSDECPVSFTSASLGSELIKAGITFRGYAETMPRNGFEGCQAHPDHLPSGWLYMRKHVPWPDFPKVPRSDSWVYHKPFTAPTASFIWITPNMCNDMHDCSIATGDKWASKNLPKLIAWDTANEGVLILTFDENDGSPGNQIPTILAGNVNPGSYGQNITHYSVLRTIENVFGVKPLGNAGSATPIEGVVK
jgi:phosphatidylinositol-3-phosphatase